ncbi:site-specific DNA-methyltransferase [Streptomyces sulphureus]|uniref:site-specific DNA-methyltransferase n=1 Tax=Streptomyces sulphureus TaxID=47758 RepID=UPI0003A90826|nr:site-specific DNA-methyltransferase [Streptomyces sulphureus]
MAGRLALSWVNKHQALVPDGDGGYEWIERDDPRVTEVRLLQQTGHMGEVSGTAEDNLLIQGDSYDALQALSRTPEYAKRYRGKVKLVYIDPPFNTGQAFEHYDDALEHSVWLGMMRERLLLIRDLLASDGSVWVHLDDAEMAYCRVLMDEIFGRGNFLASVVWKRRNDPRNSAVHMSADHDYILVFAKRLEDLVIKQLPRTEAMDKAYVNPDNDPRGPWRRTDVSARNYYSKGMYPVTTPSGRVISGPMKGRYWSISKEKLDELDADGRIYWGAKGDSLPYLKRYLSEVQGGRVPSSVWHPEEVGFVRNGKEEVRRLVGNVFATPKPETMIQRIIQMTTEPGDIVLDCFAGSGTTAAVAHKMGRKWVGVELSPENVENFTRARLEKVVAGKDPGGITEQIAWSGGGGFQELRVGSSLYERVGHRVVLADWAKGDDFDQAVAAQLGFVHQPEGPFVGVKGRVRLAVVDGIADEVVVASIVSYLNEDERVTVVAKGAAPGTEQALRDLSKGSRLLKAPRDLIRRGKVVR